MTREELFVAYQATIVSTRDPADPDQPSAWSDPALVCLQRGEPAVVLTGWNPGFERPGLAFNRKRNEELRQRLRETGYEVWPADGSSADEDFREEGFLAWGMPEPLAVDIARAFGQFAIYAYDVAGRRRVVAC